MRVTIFGLGEAGSLFASDLAAAGVDVRAFDPADVPTPEQVTRHTNPVEAVAESIIVMSVTSAADARSAFDQAWDAIASPTIYADMATAAPGAKVELARIASDKGVPFADVALMAPVPGRGLSTPALASGIGAGDLSELLNSHGASIEFIGQVAGEASARKLTRSIVTKGLAALIIEALQAAEVRGEGDWARAHIDELVTEVDAGMVERLISGTAKHGARRLEEMEAAAGFLDDLGVQPLMTRAIVERLRPYGGG